MSVIPIAVLAYDRPNSLRRVLDSLLRAEYPQGENVPLNINVDGGGPNGTAELAYAFDWPYGDKVVNVRQQKVGMRENSLLTGDLCLATGAVIFIEDDSFVSPAFYRYCRDTYEKYSKSADVFAVSLYGFELCEFDMYRFVPLLDGYDNYFIKSASTWAVMFMRPSWVAFREWLKRERANPITLEDGVPQAVTLWPATSWKRFINKYLVQKNLYFAYPRGSFATNFAEKGSHFAKNSDNFKVRLSPVAGNANYSTTAASRARYDAFYEPEAALLASYLNDIDPDVLDIDLRQIKTIDQLMRPYVLSTRASSRLIHGFGNLHIPLEANVINRNDGDWISFSKREHLIDRSGKSQPVLSRYYHSDLGRRRELGLVLDRVRRLVGR